MRWCSLRSQGIGSFNAAPRLEPSFNLTQAASRKTESVTCSGWSRKKEATTNTPPRSFPKAHSASSFIYGSSQCLTAQATPRHEARPNSVVWSSAPRQHAQPNPAKVRRINTSPKRKRVCASHISGSLADASCLYLHFSCVAKLERLNVLRVSKCKELSRYSTRSM